MFVGHYSNYVECLNVDYTASHKQPYMEIQLDILGCKDIYESLERFCEEEKMEGQNKYNAENFGLQVSAVVDRNTTSRCPRTPVAMHDLRASLLIFIFI